MTDWLRLWHDMPTDPKWRVIARKSGQPLPCVIALYTLMLTTASAADDRGNITSLTDEDAAAALDMDEDDIARIRDAMQGRVTDGERLTGWDRRQPKRERENDLSTQRVKEHRHRSKYGSAVDETPCNAMQRQETPRVEESREDIPLSNDNGGQAALDPVKAMFDGGVALITESGKSPQQARSWLAKARKEHGTEAVIVAVGRAKREGAIDPVSFMEGCLRANQRAGPAPVVGL